MEGGSLPGLHELFRKSYFRPCLFLPEKVLHPHYTIKPTAVCWYQALLGVCLVVNLNCVLLVVHVLSVG